MCGCGWGPAGCMGVAARVWACPKPRGRTKNKMAASTMIRSVFKKELFSGKVAVVTGGATGLGRAITEELSSLGCKVVIASRRLENLEKTAQEINEATPISLRPRVFPYQCNIRNEEQVRLVIVKLIVVIIYFDWYY